MVQHKRHKPSLRVHPQRVANRSTASPRSLCRKWSAPIPTATKKAAFDQLEHTDQQQPLVVLFALPAPRVGVCRPASASVNVCSISAPPAITLFQQMRSGESMAPSAPHIAIDRPRYPRGGKSRHIA